MKTSHEPNPGPRRRLLSRLQACVVMRFGAKGSEDEAHLDSVYRGYIKPALEEVGYDCTRADEVSRPGVILDDVLQMLFETDICVVDITRSSANVFYELAIRHLARPNGTILICDRSRAVDSAIPFDIASLRVHSYEFTKELRTMIQDAVRELKDSEKFDNHIYEPFHKFIGSSKRPRNGAQPNGETASEMQPWQVIEQAAEEIESDLDPKLIIAEAHDIHDDWKHRKSVRGAEDDPEVRSKFVSCVEKFFQASVFMPSAKEFIELHWLADRLDMRTVADAILEQGLQKYPKHRRLIGRRLDMLARSDRPAVLEKVKSELKDALKLKNGTIDMTHASDRVDLLGLLLDVYQRLGEHDEPLKLMNDLMSRSTPTAFILRNYARAFERSSGAGDESVIRAYQAAVLHADQDGVAAQWFAITLQAKGRSVDALELRSLACFREGDYAEYFACLANDLSAALYPKRVLPGYSAQRPPPDCVSLTKNDVAKVIVMARSCTTYDVEDDDRCVSAMRRARLTQDEIEEFMENEECDEYPQNEREDYAADLYTKLRSPLTGG